MTEHEKQDLRLLITLWRNEARKYVHRAESKTDSNTRAYAQGIAAGLLTAVSGLEAYLDKVVEGGDVKQ